MQRILRGCRIEVLPPREICGHTRGRHGWTAARLGSDPPPQPSCPDRVVMSVMPTTPAAAPERWRTLAIALIAAAVLVGLTRAPQEAGAASGGAGTGGTGNTPGAGKTALDRQGMWIWYVDRSERRQPLEDHRQGASLGHRHPLHQVGRQQRQLEPVQRIPGRSPAPRPASTSAPGSSSTATTHRRGQGRRRLGPQGRRLPGDRRRGPVRGQVRLRRPLHPGPAPAHRRRLSALARGLSLRRLPPGLPLLGLPRAGGRPVQPAADVLERDRDLGPRRLRAHLLLQPRLRPSRSTRSVRPTRG